MFRLEIITVVVVLIVFGCFGVAARKAEIALNNKRKELRAARNQSK